MCKSDNAYAALISCLFPDPGFSHAAVLIPDDARLTVGTAQSAEGPVRLLYDSTAEPQVTPA